MPKQKRYSTKYPGVFFIEGEAVGTGKPERIYYIRYRRGGKTIEEKAGRQFQDDMTPARAANLRARRIEGDEPSNTARRESEDEERKAQEGRWTLTRLWVEYKRQRAKNKSLAVDDNRFRLHIEPVLGAKEPAEIITLDVDRLRMALLKKRSPQTVKHVLAQIKRIIRFGVKKGLCPAPDPHKLHIEMPRVDNATTEDLTPEELARLLGAIEADPNRKVGDMMKMALYSGMRRGELFRLEWRDLDFEKSFIRIRDPKGGKSQTIPMTAAARGVLSQQPKTDSPFVFPGRNGAQLKSIQEPTRRIRKRAGLPKGFRPMHGLRHVFASMLASSGRVDLYTLQKMLTHKSAVMTQRYAHLRDEALKRGAAEADKLFQGLPGQDEGASKVVPIKGGK